MNWLRLCFRRRLREGWPYKLLAPVATAGLQTSYLYVVIFVFLILIFLLFVLLFFLVLLFAALVVFNILLHVGAGLS